MRTTSHIAGVWRRPKSSLFHSSNSQTMRVDTSKFTGKGEVKNNLYVGVISKESWVRLSPSLYSRTTKGLSVRELVDAQ